MKAVINLEFSDDELRKYASDVGRRWAVSFFQEAFKTGKRLKIPPGLAETIGQALASAFDSKPKVDPGPTAWSSSDGPVPPGTSRECVRVSPESIDGRLPSNPNLDEGWICCHCSTYNGVHRAACRYCDHERCDVIVPPPPSSRQRDPSVQ